MFARLICGWFVYKKESLESSVYLYVGSGKTLGKINNIPHLYSIYHTDI